MVVDHRVVVLFLLRMVLVPLGLRLHVLVAVFGAFEMVGIKEIALFGVFVVTHGNRVNQNAEPRQNGFALYLFLRFHFHFSMR